MATYEDFQAETPPSRTVDLIIPLNDPAGSEQAQVRFNRANDWIRSDDAAGTYCIRGIPLLYAANPFVPQLSQRILFSDAATAMMFKMMFC